MDEQDRPGLRAVCLQFNKILAYIYLYVSLSHTHKPVFPKPQVWMWYLSVTLLVFMVTFLSIRCLLFFFAWILGYEFWVLPRLFDETLAFAESFVPVRLILVCNGK